MNRHLESIRIQDFQNHQDTHIKLYPGLNLITGSSDSGKSGLFRSLSTAFLDIFRKQDVRDGQKNAQITINFKNGDYEKPVLVSSLFREVSSTQYVPYHLILKWGSQYHRYRKYLIDGTDILSGFINGSNITQPIDGEEFFDNNSTLTLAPNPPV